MWRVRCRARTSTPAWVWSGSPTCLQGVDNLYEIDQVYPVIEHAAQLAGKRYGDEHEDDVRLRVVGDHIRSGLMLITDGVTPGNEARGYVLRRLLRRVVALDAAAGREPSRYCPSCCRSAAT